MGVLPRQPGRIAYRRQIAGFQRLLPSAEGVLPRAVSRGMTSSAMIVALALIAALRLRAQRNSVLRAETARPLPARPAALYPPLIRTEPSASSVAAGKSRS